MISWWTDNPEDAPEDDAGNSYGAEDDAGSSYGAEDDAGNSYDGRRGANPEDESLSLTSIRFGTARTLRCLLG